MTRTLTVNPIACQGHGACAELLPELIALDEWGYPLVAGDAIPKHLHRAARQAAAACPVLALKLRGVSLPSSYARRIRVSSAAASRSFLV